MDRQDLCARFLDAVPYTLYPFQEEALLAWFESEGGVLVSAPTGMGKTLIAEAALFEALHTGQRLYYTTPLIALTDQKFREFADRAEAWGFPRDRVGLLTGNRRDNPDAPVLVVVAEILLNHLLAGDERLAQTAAVVMDEFHNFNDFERGIVWELSLTLLPPHVRLMLLSATAGNTVDFLAWLRQHHGRNLRLVQTNERRVPLEFIWVGDKLLTELLPSMVSANDAESRVPALVFCFNRDECWEVAEKIKGVDLISKETRAEIEAQLDRDDFKDGIGPKLWQMLIRGVGVHHAGVLPKYKEAIERLFLKKLIPFVICTETLAAGINLPARSVVMSTLLKGKRGEKKLIFPAIAHQIFGRAGRPQFDSKGYVYALAHEDDVRIWKWKQKYDQLDPKSKDPGILRARKNLEAKRPTRRKTEQYWMEGQFQTLIRSGPANLASRAMIPYQVLVYLLTRSGALHDVRGFLAKRFNTPERLREFQDQLDHMISNLAAFGYLTRAEDGDHVTVHDTIRETIGFRSVDPLFGAFLAKMLPRTQVEEKLHVLEAALEVPPTIERNVRPLPATPSLFETEELDPLLVHLGVVAAAIRPPSSRWGTEDAPSRGLQPARSEEPLHPAHPPAQSDEPPSRAHPPARSDEPPHPAHPPARSDEPPHPAHPPARSDEPPHPAHPPARSDEPPSRGLQPARSEGAIAASPPTPLPPREVQGEGAVDNRQSTIGNQAEGQGEGASGNQAEGQPARPAATFRTQPAHRLDYDDDYDDEDEPQQRLTLAEKLALLFAAKLASPENVFAQPKWIAGGVFEHGDDFYKFIRARDLAKNEGLVLRHLLRLVILAGEFAAKTEDPSYAEIAARTTKVCESVDRRYTERFLESEARARETLPAPL